MIRVDVRLFTILRHRPDGQIRGHVSLELSEDATVADVLRELDVPADLPIVISVNDEQADPSTTLQDGDHIELIPAVAGGSALIFPLALVLSSTCIMQNLLLQCN